VKKAIVSIVAALLSIAMFAGCGAGQQAASNPAGGTAPGKLNMVSDFPIANEVIELSVVVTTTAISGRTEDLWFWQFMETFGNVKFSVEQIPSDVWNERFNLLIVSKSLPDMFYNCYITINEIVKYGMLENIFLDMNSYIDLYAPNVRKAFIEYPLIEQAMTCPDGGIYQLPSILATDYPTSTLRLYYNDSWLKALNFNYPDTLDELYEVLTGVKEGDPRGDGVQVIPFSSGAYPPFTPFVSAYGYPASAPESLAVKDGEIKMLAVEPEYRDYLEYVNKLYKEELIDKDIFTQSIEQVRAKYTENLLFITSDHPASFGHSFEDWQCFAPVTGGSNTEKIWCSPMQYQNTRLVISSGSNSKEACMRFANWAFSDKGYLQYHGPSVEMDADILLNYPGWYVDENGGSVNPTAEDALDGWTYINKYGSPVNGYPLGYAPSNNRMNNLFNLNLVQAGEAKLWFDSLEKNWIPYFADPFPQFYFGEDDLRRIDELSVPIYDYIKEMNIKFIVGDEPLSNFDKYTQELKNLGIDEFMTIYRNVYAN